MTQQEEDEKRERMLAKKREDQRRRMEKYREDPEWVAYRKQYMKEYRMSHSAAICTYNNEYYKNHLEERRAYYKKNREKLRAYAKNYYKLYTKSTGRDGNELRESATEGRAAQAEQQTLLQQAQGRASV